MLRLHTLGAVSVTGTSKPLSGAATQRRRLAILALLAAAGDRGLSRDTILGLLWAETGVERARHALAQSLYALRRDLEAEDLFLGTTELRLNPALMTSDIAELEATIASGELARAIALYAGPFLDGLFVGDAPEFERWVDGERARVHALVARAVRAHASALTSAGDHAHASAAWKRLASLAPLDGSAILDVMRGLAAAGDRAGALVQARIHETLLREELEAAPDPAISALATELKSAPVAGSSVHRPAPPRSDPLYITAENGRGGHA